jgi:hypothetical protein
LTSAGWNLAIVFATFCGPFLAVYVTERQRKKADARNRKIHIFRALMTTRTGGIAAPQQVEALNLVELEFGGRKRSEREVIDKWRLYKSHLYDHNYPKDHWPARKKELLVDLLYAMSLSLGYDHDKADINSDAYYPVGYGDYENDALLTRKYWLEVLQGNRSLPMNAGPAISGAQAAQSPTTPLAPGIPPTPAHPPNESTPPTAS